MHPMSAERLNAATTPLIRECSVSPKRQVHSIAIASQTMRGATMAGVVEMSASASVTTRRRADSIDDRRTAASGSG